jgi:hypothetical protein
LQWPAELSEMADVGAPTERKEEEEEEDDVVCLDPSFFMNRE